MTTWIVLSVNPNHTSTIGSHAMPDSDWKNFRKGVNATLRRRLDPRRRPAGPPRRGTAGRSPWDGGRSWRPTRRRAAGGRGGSTGRAPGAMPEASAPGPAPRRPAAPVRAAPDRAGTVRSRRDLGPHRLEHVVPHREEAGIAVHGIP